MSAKTMLDQQLAAANDAAFPAPYAGPTLNGVPLIKRWVAATVCAQCEAPVAGMHIVFCATCRELVERFKGGAK